MNARIGAHVTDVRDSRPIFEITYREWSSPRTSFVRIQADNVEDAADALLKHVGNPRYSVTKATVVTH